MTLLSLGWISLAAAVALPAALAAQGWVVQAAAGRAVNDPVSARVGSSVASLGVEFADGAARWLYLSAGAPLGQPGPAWAAGGVGTWLGMERRGWTAGVSLGAHLFGFGAADSLRAGGGATVELMPAVTATRGLLRAELASGVFATTDVSGDSAGGGRAISQSSARLVAAPAAGVEMAGEARYVRSRDGGFPYAGAALQGERGRYGGWAYAGTWLDRGFPAPRTAYGVGASLRLRRARLEAGLRQEPLDPLYMSIPRRTWTVQLSHALGRVSPPVRRPAAAAARSSLAPVVANGRAVFRLPRAAYPRAPSLVGDFNRWRPQRMAADGAYWTATVRVARGAHHYGYKTAAGTFFTPAGVPTVSDGFGGTSAVLVVP